MVHNNIIKDGSIKKDGNAEVGPINICIDCIRCRSPSDPPKHVDNNNATERIIRTHSKRKYTGLALSSSGKIKRDTSPVSRCKNCVIDMWATSDRNGYNISSLRIGRGSFSKVYMATAKENTKNHEKYALKIFCEKCYPSSIKHYNSEKTVTYTINKYIAETNILLDSPLLIANDFFQSNNNITRFICMDYAEGGTLFDYISTNKSLCERDVIKTILCIVKGLVLLHNAGIVHRDVKMENVFIMKKDNFDTIKLGDFGFSICTKSTPLIPYFMRAQYLGYIIDQNKRIYVRYVGTPRYVPPEVANGFQHEFEGDIWAIGVILYCMIVGEFPFDSENIENESYTGWMRAQIISSQHFDFVPRISHIFHEYGASNELIRFVTACFVLNPSIRPSAIDLVGFDLFVNH